MMINRNRRLRSYVVLNLLIGCLLADPVWATARSWNTNSSGNAAVAANWSPNGMPQSADDLTFNRAVNLTITFDSNVTLVNSHTYRGTNQVTLNLTTPHSVSSFFDIGTVSGDDAVVVMSAGQLDSSGNFVMGEVSGATGRFTISGASTQVQTNGTTDDFLVGAAGAGFLTLSGAAQVESKDDIILGSSATGNGTVSVSGGTGSFPNIFVTTLKTTGSNGASNIIVGSLGTGTLTLASGGLADSIDDVMIAPSSGSTGTVTVGGNFSIIGSRLHATQHIDIARNATALAAGTGLVTVNTGGIIDANQELRLGDANGGSGTLHIAGGIVRCESFLCDQTGHATLTFDDGFMSIDGGTLTPPAASLVLNGAGAGDEPEINLINGATYVATGQLRVGNNRGARFEVLSGSLLDVHNVASAPLLGASVGGAGTVMVDGAQSLFDASGRTINVGLSGTGLLNIQDGGEARTTDLAIGNQATGIGTVNVSGVNAHLNVSSTLRLGMSGAGTMNVQSGAIVDCASSFVASAAGSSGVGNVFDNGSRWNVTGSLYVGGTNAASGGSGEVNISNGGTLTVNGLLRAWPDGDVTVDGTGSISAPNNSLSVQGTLRLTNGGVVNGDVEIDNGTLRGAGTVNGTILGTSAVSNIIADGTLTIGDITSSSGVSNFGTTTVNASGNLTLRDQNNAAPGDVVMNGGILNTTAGLLVGASDNVSGIGTINGEIFMNGSMTPGNAATPLTINGVLHNTTSNINGTKLHFGPAGVYDGSGMCVADITGHATSRIAPTGTLTIGRNTTAGVFFLGSLEVGGHIVTMLDSNGAVLGGNTTISNGRLECPAGIGNQNGGTIQGDGLFVGSLTNSGLLDPHSTNPSLGGLMTVQGNFVNNASGIVDIEIGDTPGSGNNDRINVSGTATFGGVMRVRLKNNYVPRVGEQFIAINANAGRSNEFATLIAPVGNEIPCNHVTFVLVYSSTAAIVLIRPPLGCTALGDLNSDGGCNAPDIPIFMNSILFGPYNHCSDMNGDCVNDGTDVQIFVNCLL